MATDEQQQQPRLGYENGYCGIEKKSIENDFRRDGVPGLIDYHLKSGFHFVVIPLKEAYRSSLMERCTNSCGSSSKTSDCLVGMMLSLGNISSCIDLDSEDEMLRKDSEITLRKEVDFASTLGLQVCLIPAPKGLSCANYVRCLNHILQDFSNIQFLLRIPLEELHDDNGDSGGVSSNHMVDFQTYSLKLWRCFYHQCKLKFRNRLSVALDFPCSLPSASFLGSWSNEPVKAAIIKSNTFTRDALGRVYNVDYHQKVLGWLFSHSIKIVMHGVRVHTSTGYRIIHPLQSILNLLTFMHGSFRLVAKAFKKPPPPPKVFEKYTSSNTMIHAYIFDGIISSGGSSDGRSTIGDWVEGFLLFMSTEKLNSAMYARLSGSIELVDKFEEKLFKTPGNKTVSKMADWIFETAKESGAEGDVFIIIAGPLEEIGGQFLDDPCYRPDDLSVVVKRTKVEVAKDDVQPEWETWTTTGDNAKGTIFKALRKREIAKTGNGEDIRVLFIHKEGVIQGGAAYPCH